MAKKRNTKTVAKKNNQQTNLTARTEQILLSMPSIIAMQSTRDLLIQKQKEDKLKTTLSKQKSQEKKFAQKILELKKKNTVAARQQIKTVQKSLSKLKQSMSETLASLEMIQKNIVSLMQRRAKYLALQNHLKEFEKNWAKKMSKTGKIKAKAKRKSKIDTQAQQKLEILELPVQDKQGPESVPMDKAS